MHIHWAKENLLDSWGSSSKPKYHTFGFCICKNDPYHNKEIGGVFTVQLLSFAEHLSSDFLEMSNWCGHWKRRRKEVVYPVVTSIYLKISAAAIWHCIHSADRDISAYFGSVAFHCFSWRRASAVCHNVPLCSQHPDVTQLKSKTHMHTG